MLSGVWIPYADEAKVLSHLLDTAARPDYDNLFSVYRNLLQPIMDQG